MRTFLLTLLFLLTCGCSQNDSVDYSSIGSIVNHSEYGGSNNKENFETAKPNAQKAFDLITSTSASSDMGVEFELITDVESNVIAIALQYDDFTTDSYMTFDSTEHNSVEEGIKETSAIWYQGMTESYDIQEDRYKVCAVKDNNEEILMVLINEDVIYDVWESGNDDSAAEKNQTNEVNVFDLPNLSESDDTSEANNSAEAKESVPTVSARDGSFLTSDGNMDLSFVSADSTNGIIFEVNNKTDKNLNWQFDSIALNKRSINAQDFYVSSGNIAPNSIGEIVISFNVNADKSKYNWSEGVTSVSGQMRYFIGEGYTDMESVSFSNVSV